MKTLKEVQKEIRSVSNELSHSHIGYQEVSLLADPKRGTMMKLFHDKIKYLQGKLDALMFVQDIKEPEEKDPQWLIDSRKDPNAPKSKMVDGYFK
jgi:hypothetical protein